MQNATPMAVIEVMRDDEWAKRKGRAVVKALLAQVEGVPLEGLLGDIFRLMATGVGLAEEVAELREELRAELAEVREELEDTKASLKETREELTEAKLKAESKAVEEE